ncbi:MAG: hypothetical protein QE485_13245 [Acidovorax sp.]|uniref:hypothetical protein n=1 Tax=Acidovorax sp. TaxID=1872122 RepID=UPI00261C4A1A|nr:hypothetical protein [Acidovorax sp.]MDH4418183.1 hypothetical protein [Acidovorax sp.]
MLRLDGQKPLLVQMSTELPSDKYPFLVVIEGPVFDKQREHKERERSTAPAALPTPSRTFT